MRSLADGKVSVMKLGDIARLTKLSADDIEWSLEEEGVCSTDEYEDYGHREQWSLICKAEASALPAGGKHMTRKNLTETSIKALKPAEAGKPKNLTEPKTAGLKSAKKGTRYDVLDAIFAPGLIVRVFDKGRRTFMLKTVPRIKYPTRRAIGECGTITLDAARAKAREWHELIRRGIDPAHEEERLRREQAEIQTNSFAKVAEEYIARQVVGMRNYKRLLSLADAYREAHPEQEFTRMRALAKVITDPANKAETTQRKAAVVILRTRRRIHRSVGRPANNGDHSKGCAQDRGCSSRPGRGSGTQLAGPRAAAVQLGNRAR